MRYLLALFAIALISVVATACGGADKPVGSSFSRPSLAGNTPKRGISYDTHQSGPYRNDGDQDLIGDEDGDNRNDNDNDAPWDYKSEVNENGYYHDADDATRLKFGHNAGEADRRAITALVKRYYAGAAAGDGQTACSILIPSLAYAVPLDYGKLGPAYLRAGKTCRAVMALFFKHSHDELSAPVAVTGVRIDGNHALALLGSSTMPAGYITLQRDHRVWTVNELLGGAFS
jgi:hypothetical protein